MSRGELQPAQCSAWPEAETSEFKLLRAVWPRNLELKPMQLLAVRPGRLEAVPSTKHWHQAIGCTRPHRRHSRTRGTRGRGRHTSSESYRQQIRLPDLRNGVRDEGEEEKEEEEEGKEGKERGRRGR